MNLVFQLFITSFCLLVGVGAARAEGSESMLQVKSVAQIDGSHGTIQLRDLIVARDIPEAALQILNDVTLADAPFPGETRTFAAISIEQTLRPYLRDMEERAGQKIQVRIPARVAVTRKSFQVNAEEIQKELISQFKGFCAECQYEITDLRLPLLPTNVDPSSTWKIKLRPEAPKGSFSLPLEVSNPDSSRRTYWISGQLAIRRQVSVLSRAVSAGDKINPEDYNLQAKDVTYATDVPAKDAEIATSVAARQMAAGSILYRSFLRKEQAVKSGDVVKVTTGNSEWQLSIDGIAQGAGAVGDTVRVKISSTQKIVSGLLKEKGRVEIQ